MRLTRLRDLIWVKEIRRRHRRVAFFAHDYHKQRLVDADGEETVLTDAFHINWPRGAKARVLANSVMRGERGDPFSEARTIIGDEEGRPIYQFSTDSPSRASKTRYPTASRLIIIVVVDAHILSHCRTHANDCFQHAGQFGRIVCAVASGAVEECLRVAFLIL
jgi:hypothetical protein